MFNKLLLSTMMVLSVSLLPQVSFAGDDCKADADCKDGKVCIMAATPHVCKEPQAAGAACKRDAVCASKKCDVPAGKDTGVCK